MKIFTTCFIFIVIAFTDKAMSQGIINPVTHDFWIACTGPIPANSVAQPFGGADISNNVFSISISIGQTAPTQAWILAMGVDNSLTPVFAITNLVNISGPHPPNDFSSSQSWQITDGQEADLWAGLWYVQFDFSNGTDTGEIVSVPEPSSFDLFLCGAGIIVSIYVRKYFSVMW